MESETTLPAGSLAAKTLDFWNTSTAYNGKPSQLTKLTTEGAIHICSDNLNVLNPMRPLAQRFRAMQEAIIMGTQTVKGKKKSAVQPAATVLTLKFAQPR